MKIRYFNIPEDVLSNPLLDSRARDVYLYLVMYSRNGLVSITHKRLMQCTGIKSVVTLRAKLKLLKHSGYIQILRMGNSIRGLATLYFLPHPAHHFKTRGSMYSFLKNKGFELAISPQYMQLIEDYLKGDNDV